MSCSKPLPSCTFDVLSYLNRDQLERFSIVCRPFKNLIKRYFYSKPYRIFDYLRIQGGLYKLIHNCVQCLPNRKNYTVQQFLAGDLLNVGFTYYSYAKMRAYLGPTVRIKQAAIYVGEDSTYNLKHIAEMESIAYLWRDGNIDLCSIGSDSRIRAENFQLILNSPTILQCRKLVMINAHFSFKDYNVLYSVKVIEVRYYRDDDIDLWQQYWLQFLEQPGAKPIVVLRQRFGNLYNFLAFSSAVSPNAFKIVFPDYAKSLTEFREVNKTSGEMMEFKKGLPSELQRDYLEEYDNYTLERSSI